MHSWHSYLDSATPKIVNALSGIQLSPAMTRQIHDQFAKEYLEELFRLLGTIKKSKKVKSEVQEIDVWFEPASSASRTELPLGLLAKMAATSCLFEPFRNPPARIENSQLHLKVICGSVAKS
jgi:TnpA family transposase